MDYTKLTASGVAYSVHTTYCYAPRDWLPRQTHPDNSALGYDYDYDAIGNRTQLTATYPDGTSGRTDYSFDALNRLATVTGPEGLTVYGYDPVGNRTSLRPAKRGGGALCIRCPPPSDEAGAVQSGGGADAAL